jgi:formamidopyrimidine-DNA glycosylase
MAVITHQPTAMSEQTASDIASRMIQPTGMAPCAGCGQEVETAQVLGRTVYACDECAAKDKPEEDK